MNNQPEELLKEYRCYENGKLLCKAFGTLQVEIMNPSNRIMNYTGPSRKGPFIGPMGNVFANKAFTMNCKNCKRMQGRVLGTDGLVEIKCKYCGHTSTHNLTEMMHNKLQTLPERARETILDEVRKYM